MERISAFPKPWPNSVPIEAAEEEEDIKEEVREETEEDEEELLALFAVLIRTPRYIEKMQATKSRPAKIS